MTVGQLKAILASMPEDFDNKIVVLAQDAEGNGFDTLGEVAVGWFRNDYEGAFRGRTPVDDDTWRQAETEAHKDYTTDEDADEDDEAAEIPLDEHDHPAVCLWP
jgi:hypothetical protein